MRVEYFIGYDLVRICLSPPGIGVRGPALVGGDSNLMTRLLIVLKAGAANDRGDNTELGWIDQGEKEERRVLASSAGENDSGTPTL